MTALDAAPEHTVKFDLDHSFPFDLQTYVRIMCDPGYDAHVAANVSLKSRTELSRSDEGGVLRRCVRVVPERDLPRAAAKLIGGKTLAYDENIELDLGTGEGRWWVVPGVLEERVEATGTMLLETTPDGIRRRVGGEISVRLLGAGRLIEKFVVGQVVDGYNGGAKLMIEWSEKLADES